MTCPNCNKLSLCFCNSCKKRRRMPRHRIEKTSYDGNKIQCPYCRQSFHHDFLLDKKWEFINNTERGTIITLDDYFEEPREIEIENETIQESNIHIGKALL